MSAIRETMIEAGYRYGGFDRNRKLHRLVDAETKHTEYWTANKGHASYGIKWRNTDLEFVTSQES